MIVITDIIVLYMEVDHFNVQNLIPPTHNVTKKEEIMVSYHMLCSIDPWIEDHHMSTSEVKIISTYY